MAKLTAALGEACCAMAGAAAPSMAVTARAETDHRTCRQDMRFPEELDTTEEPLDPWAQWRPMPSMTGWASRIRHRRGGFLLRLR
jgi:hypothetical protein